MLTSDFRAGARDSGANEAGAGAGREASSDPGFPGGSCEAIGASGRVVPQGGVTASG